MLGMLFAWSVPITSTGVAYSTAVLAGLYVTSVAIYRLYLSPISGFPGPRLAALTWAYEFYYDWMCPGKYYARVAEMHKAYGNFCPDVTLIIGVLMLPAGPIVRVTPTELHILDPSYYEHLYVTAAVRRTDIPYDFGQGTGFHGMIRLIPSHAYNPLTGVPRHSCACNWS
jgi:hypothetical protein